jgi:hypothetical protein
MTPDQYRTALQQLGLSQVAAGRVLGVSQKTAHNYAISGPSGPAALALALLLSMPTGDRQMWLDASQPRPPT